MPEKKRVQLPPIDPTSDWTRFFSSGSLQRGRMYALENRVKQVEGSPCEQGLRIVATVQGSMGSPYRLVIDVTLDARQRVSYLVSTCSCAMSINCKHAVAACVQFFEKHLPTHGTALDHKLQWWVESLERAHHEITPPALGPAEIQRLHFLLAPAAAKIDVRLVVLQPNGTLKKVRAHDLVNNPQYALEDIAILLKIGLGYLPQSCALTGAHGAQMLKLIIETGRAYWKKMERPVRLGEARPATLGWTMDALGFQKAQINVEGSCEILAVEPPWYFDPLTGACGPLDTGLKPELTRLFLNAPPVPASQAASLDVTLRQRFPTVPFPTIRKLEVLRDKKIKLVPHLHLLQMGNPEAVWKYDAPPEIGAAILKFKYGAHEISPGDPGGTISKIENGVLHEIVRDLKAEVQASHHLLMLGFYHLDTGWGQRAQNVRGTPLTLGSDLADWFDFAAQEVQLLEAGGWKVTFDPGFNLKVVEPTEWYSDAAAEQGNDWFGVELGVMVDGKKVNLLPILQKYLARNPHALEPGLPGEKDRQEPITVQLADGRLLSVPAERLSSVVNVLAELFNGEKLDRRGRLRLNKLRAAEIPSLQNSEWRWKGSDELKELGAKLRNFKGISVVSPSPGLQASLRPYQQEGLNWLQFLREYNLGGALADDMGLGKTVQALAHLLAEKDAGRMDRPSLVVAPTSLMTNWRTEAERFAPGLRTLVLHGLERHVHFEKIKDHDLIVTSYALLPRDEAVLLKHDFHCVILDEAQYIKNPKTKYAQVACALKARHRLCLTGTPMENHLGELWSLFNFVLPGFLSDETRFRQTFRNPIEKHSNDARRKMLAHRIAPFILRRKKEDVATDLPPKTEITQNIELEGAQRDLYETIRLAMHQKVREEISKKGVNRSHIIILDALLKLRQVCCDPRLVPLDFARRVHKSAKLELLMDLVPEMVAEGRRILLFSQFTSMLALIEEKLTEAELRYVILTGETTDRATPIAKFQAGEVPIFLISLKAGGTGLNLTAADTVIHYDPWWNPAVENQATDRAHRIGQDKQVFVYKLITTGTVEEKIVAMQGRKKALVAGLLDEGQAEKLQLTAEDLEVLFAPIK